MASDFRLKEQLPNLTEEIVETYHEVPKINHLGHCPLPRYEEIIAAVKDLKEIIYPVCKNIVGIDREHAVNYCVQNHHFGKWHEDDIDNPSLVFKDTFDLIIVSDVIEHLVNPDKLLDYIKQHSNRDTYIIVSTPERDVIHGKKSIGPPRNRAHVREWNRTEFRNYFHSSGLGIVKHFMIGEAGLSIVQIFRNVVRRRPLKKCQVVLCHVIQ